VRVGIGFDAHRLVPGRRLVLGGVEIPHGKGLLGHSDADALLHALCDAILGALGLGDIGTQFPDTDARFKDIASTELLARVRAMAEERGYRAGNVDMTVLAEEPRLAPHIDAMRGCIARVLGCGAGDVGLKATTTEGMGFCGRGEGIAAMAVATLVRARVKAPGKNLKSGI
jgi:2-C-methyl-D-erythritol 2,4-cyclodiphosphate synthase